MENTVGHGDGEFPIPRIVDRAEWEDARRTLLNQEKALTRMSDAIAAQRRRMPAVEVPGDYEFTGPDATVTLRDLFDGRRRGTPGHQRVPAPRGPCPPHLVDVRAWGRTVHAGLRPPGSDPVRTAGDLGELTGRLAAGPAL